MRTALFHFSSFLIRHMPILSVYQQKYGDLRVGLAVCYRQTDTRGATATLKAESPSQVDLTRDLSSLSL
jgi:hypothetical protein